MQVVNIGDVAILTLNGPCNCSILLREYDASNVPTGRTLVTIAEIPEITAGVYRLSSNTFAVAAGTYTWRVDTAASGACASNCDFSGAEFSITVRAAATPAAACATCVPASIAVPSAAAVFANAGSPLSFTVPLLGTQPFSFCGQSLPAGITAEIVGNMVVVRGNATPGVVAFSVTNSCSCECASYMRVIRTSACPINLEITNDTITEPGLGRDWSITSSDPACTGAKVRVTGTRGGSVYENEFDTTLPYVYTSPVVSVDEDLTVSVTSMCDHECTVSERLHTRLASGNAAYCWSMLPTVAPVGSEVVVNVQLPSGCPPNATLSLDVYDGLVLIRTESFPAGRSTFTVPASDAGKSLTYRPSAAQNVCLAGYPSCVAETYRITPTPGSCAYYWAMQPALAPVGSIVTTTFTPPAGCPPGVPLSLDVFNEDGTPYFLVGATQPLVVSVPAGTSTHSPVQSDAGKTVIFRPSATQQACIAGCTPSIAEQRRTVPPPDCVVSWNLSTLMFTAGVTGSQTYTATGIPAGCSLVLGAYNGAAPLLDGSGSHITVTLTAAAPSVTFPQTWGAANVGSDFNIRPLPVQASCLACVVQPSRVDFDVQAGATATCTLQLFGGCNAGVFNGQVQGATPGTTYEFREMTNGVWGAWTTWGVAPFSAFSVASSNNPQKYQVRDASNPLCASNELAACGSTAGTNYYCSAGNCAPATSAPPGTAGPFSTLAECQTACQPSGTCVATMYPPDDFSPAPASGSTLHQNTVIGQPWSFSIVGAAGVTVAATPLQPGMTAVQSGPVMTIDWTPTTAGDYVVSIQGTKAGCTSTSYTLVIHVSASGSSCATLSISVAKASSAYTPPSATSFNSADQNLVTTVTGPVGGTYKLVGNGTVNGAPFSVTSATQTIGATGTNSFSAPIGQCADYDVVWEMQPDGAAPVTLCAGGVTFRITGSTCVSSTLLQNANGYVLTVTAPPNAVAVPFTASFGGVSFGGSDQCADNTFGVVNSALTTDSGGGGNEFVFNVTGLPSGYKAAVKITLNAGTSQATHQLCGVNCHEVSIP